MKVKWNNCFLCLNDLSVGALDEGPSAKKRRKGCKRVDKNTKCKAIRASSVVLLNYFLDTKCKKYSDVIGNIVELIEETEENRSQTVRFDDAVGVKFCDKCETQLRAVGELHRQLEVVQMKLVHVLKTVRSTVIHNSRKNNGDSNGLEIFEDWLRDQEEKHVEEDDSRLIKQRSILNALYSFQAGVIENAKNSIDIPRMFLDKFAYSKPFLKVENSMGPLNVLVKTEPVDLDEFMNNSMPSPEEPDWSAGSADNELQKPIGIVTKRKTRKHQAVSTSTTSEVKVKDDDEIVPRRKIRSASFLASQRISAFKKKTIKRSKIKREKIEPPKKIRARILQPFRLKLDSEKQKLYKKPHKYWACATCSFSTQNIYRFQHHLRTHEANVGKEDSSASSSAPQFRCEKCTNVTFSVKQHYQFHEACHLGAIFMTCDICNATCEPMALKEHLKTHVEKVFPCQNCDYCCSTRENYLHHLTYHLNSDIHECDICRQICSSRKLLIDHYHTDHKVLKMQVCNVDGCTKEFLDSEVLLRHQNSHTKPFVCQHCGKSFSSAQTLEIHLASQHTGEKRYTCEHCSEAFPSRGGLHRHMMSQHGAPKLKCKYCEKEYTSRSTLNSHMVQVHVGSGANLNSFVCEYPLCGRIFGKRNILERHKHMHSTKREFSCEQCGGQFKFPQGLKRHMKIHLGDKKYKCHLCEKTFLLQQYLNNHLRVHSGEKLFVCEKCGNAFNHQATLFNHKRSCNLRN